jgi:hypothetical protein
MLSYIFYAGSKNMKNKNTHIMLESNDIINMKEKQRYARKYI